MRTTAPVLVALGTLLLAAACDEPTELDKSRDTWVNASAGQSYSYIRRSVSWTGYSSTTKITVRDDGVVVQRDYQNSEGVSWTESGDQIGTHTTGGYPAVNLDQLYDQCESEILTVDPQENEITFALDERGFLENCYFVPNGCQDDCVDGILIEELQFVAGGDCKTDGDC